MCKDTITLGSATVALVSCDKCNMHNVPQHGMQLGQGTLTSATGSGAAGPIAKLAAGGVLGGAPCQGAGPIGARWWAHKAAPIIWGTLAAGRVWSWSGAGQAECWDSAQGCIQQAQLMVGAGLALQTG